MINRFSFIKNMLLYPRDIGALAPASKRLSHTLVLSSNAKKSTSIVELGTGTGIITKEIKQSIPSNILFFAMELNKEFALLTKKTNPSAEIYNDCASKLPHYLKINGKERCETIISSLPWSSFDEELQDKLINTIFKSLDTNGRFVTYAYVGAHFLPNGQRMRKKLSTLFTNTTTSKIIWRNFPPAFVYICDK